MVFGVTVLKRLCSTAVVAPSRRRSLASPSLLLLCPVLLLLSLLLLLLLLSPTPCSASHEAAAMHNVEASWDFNDGKDGWGNSTV